MKQGKRHKESKSGRRIQTRQGPVHQGLVHPHAGGIDMGATEIYVAAPPAGEEQDVRCYKTFTEDLHRLADWLQERGVDTVAMESTGVYWIPLFQILEARGIEVCLVNARHVKNVTGRKSDVQDCQWLQHLHAVGLLAASFRPEQEICALRTVLRHRAEVVQDASGHIQHMQKSLDQMNLQLHHVISELAGMTGLAILDAILAGERDRYKLAGLRDARIRASEETIVKSLVGDYRPEHLFTLRQALEAYRFCQKQLAACDDQIRRMLQEMDSFEGGDGGSPAPWANDAFDLKSELHRVLGVDLTQVPGLEVKTAQVLLSEVGVNLAKSFRSAEAFVSWLGLCPDNRVSGGKVLSSRIRKVHNRVANALRGAARSLHHSDSPLGAYYRRMRAKLGAPKAIVATAHKLARIIYHMLTSRQAYDPSVFDEMERKRVQYVKAKLQAHARALGMRLVPAEAAC